MRSLFDERTGVVHNFCWSMPAPPFPGPVGLIITFYCLRSEIPNLEDQVPVFISPRNRVAQLFHLEMGTLFIACY
jgi:hypothetical protein